MGILKVHSWLLRVVLIFLSLARLNRLSSQGLVANGSFEERNLCVEFRALCAPEAWFFIPGYIKASPAKDSNHFEIISMGNYARDVLRGNYLYTKLLCQLKEGQQYSFSISIKASSDFQYLDVWFGKDEPGQGPTSDELSDPAFTIRKENFKNAKDEWKKVEYTFTAKGHERFMMLGNLSYANSDLVPKKLKRLHYSVDNIDLVPLVPQEKNCPEYNAIRKQVYDQNFRHPPRLIEEVLLDTSLLPSQERPKEEIEYVIIDTPPVTKPKADTLIIPDVLFEFNSSIINKKFIKSLDSLIDKISGKVYSKIKITGHTDDIGAPSYNHTLSLNRAEAIKEYLAAKLMLDRSIIEVKGAGEEQPVATNKTKEGRQKNRRVEIILER